MAEDWSRVRSPSRARRRLKQGHRQNIKEVEEYSEWAERMDLRFRQMLLREDTEALKKMQETI